MEANVAKQSRDPWERVLLAYAWAVLALWVVAMVLNSLPTATGITPPNVTPIMAIVSGGLFGGNVILRYVRRRRNGENGD